MILENLLNIALDAALKAGLEILNVYQNSEIKAEYKKDQSPLTEADKNAHLKISEILESTNIPVLSEEGLHTSYDVRRNWEYLWIVDPLDGTKEFINRNGDFTVNIALIHENTPVLGIVYVPVSGVFYYALKEKGAFRSKINESGNLQDILKNAICLPEKSAPRPFTIVASRSHMNEETADFIKKMEEEKGNIATLSRGSSLKICMVAEGVADVYPRFGPTMEWDTAAGHAIAIESGCLFTKEDGVTSVVYNKADLLNPFFIVFRK